jgi:hypothetical protein
MGSFKTRCAAALSKAFICVLAVIAAGCNGVGLNGTGDAATSTSTSTQSVPSTPPSIGGTPATTAVVGTAYSFQPAAWDTDGGALTFSIKNQPAWASFDTSSGQLTGTPTSASLGMSAPITISVTDGTLSAQLSPFQIDVSSAPVAPPAPPTISGTPPVSVQAGSHYLFQPAVSGPNGATLTLSITNLPSWATFNTATGQLAGTPPNSAVGSYSDIAITVSDGQSSTSLAPFSIQVTSAPVQPPQPPTISGVPPAQVQAGQPYSFAPAARDANGSPLTFSIQNKPAWASFSAGTGQLAGTPASSAVGPYPNIVISVSDGQASAALPAFSIQVTPAVVVPPQPPTITGSPSTQVVAGQTYSFTPTAADVNGNPLTFSVQNKPAWANFSTATGQLSGTPSGANVGSYGNIIIGVSDGQASASLPAFSIQVTAAAPPTISGTPATQVQVGQGYSFAPAASDTNGSPLTFSIQNKPSWANFSTTTGQLSGTPVAGNVGPYGNIIISVSDGEANASLPPFSIQVTAAPPPTISGTPATQVQVGQGYSFTPTAGGANGSPLTFTVQNLPGWASFSTSTGQLSGTPTNANVGTYSNIVISVSNGESSASLAPFAIQVSAAAPPPPPTISGTPATQVQAGQAYSFTPAASDSNGSPLTFSIQNLPAWASFNSATGQLSGTPASSYVGAYPNIVISVSDGAASAALPAFAIQVTAVAPPTISGTPATQVQEGQAYLFTPTASGPNGAMLSFSIQNMPSWATFSIATGQLSGTPAVANVGTYSNIVISVSDGTSSAALPAFAITVTAPASGSLVLSWDAPTLNTNGTPLTDLTGYVISYGTSASNLSQTVSISDPTTTSYTLQNLAAGTWYFAVSATASDGTTSTLSNTTSGVVP